jgi:hypothetical protein
MTKIINATLKLLNIPTTPNENLAFNRLSLGSFEDLINAFDQYKISSLAIQIEPTQLPNIDLPAIAHIQGQTGDNFVVIKSIQNQEINYYNGKESINEAIEEFSKKWSGNILLLAPDTNAKEPNYEENLKKQKQNTLQKGIAIVALLGMVLWLFSSLNTWQSGLWLLLQIVGAGICTLLLINEYGKPNELIQKLCHVSTKTNCNAVLQSSASRLFTWLSWSEVGFLYFVGTILSCFIFPIENVIKFNLLLFPLWGLGGLFSLYYQWQVAKAWCTLCLGVLSVLVLSLLVALPYFSFSIEALSLVPLGYLLGLGIWFFVKPFITSNQASNKTEYELNNLKHNSEIFKAYLEKQNYVPIVEWSNEVVLGNPESPVTIIMVSNPFCNPCATAHKELMEWIKYFEVKLMIRFTPDTRNKANEANSVIKHLLSITNTETREKALDDWYEIKNYDKWSVKYPTEILPEAENQLTRYADWCQQTNIEFTPTIFVNGYLLKEPYNSSNLKFHLRYLIEEVELV